MFRVAKDHFGEFEKITLESSDGQQRLSVVPAFGATIIDLCLAGQSVLDTYQTPEEMLAYKWMKSGVLIPFPNRLKGGRYIWNNDAYSFFTNDSITGNALHGFGLDKPYELIKTDLSQDQGSLTCRYEYNGDNAGYPFPFTFEIQYKLKSSGYFSLRMTFYNDGFEAIPVGLGWHPYFQMGDDIGKLKMKMSPSEMIGVDQHMIPTGKRYEYDEFEEKRKIGATILDNCFAFQQNDNKRNAEIILESETRVLRFWQRMGTHQFNYMQIFTHPDRNAIALEPMTCNVDAFNNGEGLAVLLPNEKLEVSCGVEVWGF